MGCSKWRTYEIAMSISILHFQCLDLRGCQVPRDETAYPYGTVLITAIHVPLRNNKIIINGIVQKFAPVPDIKIYDLPLCSNMRGHKTCRDPSGMQLFKFARMDSRRIIQCRVLVLDFSSGTTHRVTSTALAASRSSAKSRYGDGADGAQTKTHTFRTIVNKHLY